MAQQTINIGASANDGTGDSWRDAFDKVNDNFDELYGVPQPTKLVVVNSVSDLPTPVSGQITLADSTNYLIGNDINIGTDVIIMGQDTVFEGLDENVVTVTYGGTGVMFTAVDKSCRLKGFCASCTSGTFLNASNTGGNEGTSNVIVDNIDVRCSTLGSIGNLNILAVFRCAFNEISTQGFSFTGALGNAITFNDITINQQAGSFLNLGSATFISFEVVNYLMVGAGGTTFLSGAAASANLRTGGLGRISRGRNLGSETVLSGITEDDDKWQFSLNDKLRDTRSDGLLSMQGNATATTITTPGTYVKVAGTWVVGPVSQFAGTTGGRLTYNGIKSIRVPITASISVEPTSGTNKVIALRIAKNGTTIANSQISVKADSGSPLNMSSPWQETLVPGDYIEVFVTNSSDTTSVLVSRAVLRIN